MTDQIKVMGVARHLNDTRSLVIMLNRRPSDEDMRAIHDKLKGETP